MVKSIRAVEKKTPNDLNILKHYGSSLHSTLDEFFIIIIIIKHYYINPLLPLLTLFSYYIHYINPNHLWKISIYRNLQNVHCL